MFSNGGSRGDVLISFELKYEADAVEKALQGAHHQYVKIGSNSAYPKAPLTRFVEECAKWCAGGWETGDPKLSRLGRAWIALQRLTDQDEQRRERLKLVRFLFAHRNPDAAANAWSAPLKRTSCRSMPPYPIACRRRRRVF